MTTQSDTSGTNMIVNSVEHVINPSVCALCERDKALEETREASRQLVVAREQLAVTVEALNDAMYRASAYGMVDLPSDIRAALAQVRP